MAFKIVENRRFGQLVGRQVSGAQHVIKPDEPGMQSLQSAIGNVAETNLCNHKNTVVSICGGSCTGKSTQVAASLKNHFGNDAQVLSQDNYMFASIDKQLDPIYQWDHPDFYNLKESGEVMNLLRNGFRSSMPQYSTERKQAKRIEIEPSKIILFEGLYAAFESLHNYADIVVYVEMPLYARIARRLIRNLYERYRTIHPQKILESFLMSPLKAHSDFVIQQKEHADFVIISGYSFEDSIQRFNLQPLSGSFIQSRREILFQFLLRTDELSFEVERVNGTFYFSLLYRNMIYFHFPIHADTFSRLMMLDLMAL